jgi:iron-sulfur cluster repair protein YtfE (RIC family)
MSTVSPSDSPRPDPAVLAGGLTIHEILDRFPATAPVFQQLGIHTCCGGDVTLDVAARRDGVPLDRLRDELRAALRGEG